MTQQQSVMVSHNPRAIIVGIISFQIFLSLALIRERKPPRTHMLFAVLFNLMVAAFYVQMHLKAGKQIIGQNVEMPPWSQDKTLQQLHPSMTPPLQPSPDLPLQAELQQFPSPLATQDMLYPPPPQTRPAGMPQTQAAGMPQEHLTAMY